MKVIETYKCNDCELEFGIDVPMWETPSCPRCLEHLSVIETTDKHHVS